MPNSNIRSLQIATTNDRWTEVNSRISNAVTVLCDDHDKAESLMLMVDLMTNERYELDDREKAAAEVKQQVFKYMRGYDALLRDAIEKISPAPRKLSKVG